MKKRLLIMGIVSVLALSVTACGGETLTEYQKNNTAEVSANAGTTEQMQEEASKDAQKVSVCIYYSNADASGFEAKEIEMDSLSPDNLIGELALVNVVSYDTEVLDFSKSGKSLTLDLSTDFSDYVNMMGTAGEYIVIGSLVNTFLDAYSADDILITSNGKTLETSHAIYDKPLLRFEDSGTQTTTATDGTKEAMAYHLKDTAYTQDEKQIYYPQFDGMPDEALQEKWNQAIFDIASNHFGKEDKTEYESYSVDYKVGLCTTEKISFLFTKKTTVNGETTTQTYALTFDLVEGKCLRLKDMSDAMETISYNMANQGYFKVVSKEIDREAFDEYYKNKVSDSSDFREMFLHYDYDLDDLTEEPQGYSYITADGQLELIMNAEKGLSDNQVTIETGIKAD